MKGRKIYYYILYEDEGTRLLPVHCAFEEEAHGPYNWILRSLAQSAYPERTQVRGLGFAWFLTTKQLLFCGHGQVSHTVCERYDITVRKKK